MSHQVEEVNQEKIRNAEAEFKRVWDSLQDEQFRVIFTKKGKEVKVSLKLLAYGGQGVVLCNEKYAFKIPRGANKRSFYANQDGLKAEHRLLAGLQTKEGYSIRPVSCGLLKLQNSDGPFNTLIEACHWPREFASCLLMPLGVALKSALEDEALEAVTLEWLLDEAHNALTWLHSRGRAHNDVKVDNFVVVDGRLRMIDFGAASKLGKRPDVQTRSMEAYVKAFTINDGVTKKPLDELHCELEHDQLEIEFKSLSTAN